MTSSTIPPVNVTTDKQRVILTSLFLKTALVETYLGAPSVDIARIRQLLADIETLLGKLR